MKDQELLNQLGGARISDRQIDELIGLARGLIADGNVNQAEAEFLEKWLAASYPVSQHPVLGTLYKRVRTMLADGLMDDDEKQELFDTLNALSDRDFELGEVLKATTLPVCNPAPRLTFPGRRYCFTGTFNYGDRRTLEGEVAARGGEGGSLSRKTHVLVIGTYATESWKHSSFGTKIMAACEMRDKGLPISIVTEAHWAQHL